MRAIHLPLRLHSCAITLHAHSRSYPREMITIVIPYMCFVELMKPASSKTHVHVILLPMSELLSHSPELHHGSDVSELLEVVSGSVLRCALGSV